MFDLKKVVPLPSINVSATNSMDHDLFKGERRDALLPY
jgi:hypothetical protein